MRTVGVGALSFQRPQTCRLPLLGQGPRRSVWKQRRWPARHVANVSVEEEGIDHFVAFETSDEDGWDAKYGEDSVLQYGVAIEQGPRDTMEDFVSIVGRARCGFMYAGVFDGHGGTVTAEYLVVNLYWAFSECLDENEYGQESPVTERDGALRCPPHFAPVLADAFQQTDQQLLNWLEENVSGDDLLSGSTATVALVRRDKIVVANVGDSRAVLCRNGTAVDLSTEHRVYGRSHTVESETERVESVGGWVGDGRVCDVLAVSRAFGDREFKGPGLKTMLEKGVESNYWDQEFADSVNFTGDPIIPIPDVVETAVLPDDEFVILATDGLWDVVTSAEAVATARGALKKRSTPEEVARKLTQMALNRYTKDNVAVVVIDLGQGPLAAHLQKGN